MIELQPFRINWPQKASKADFILLCIASRILSNMHFQQVVVFTGGPRERVLKQLQTMMRKYWRFYLTYSEEKFNHGKHRGNLVRELTGNGGEASWNELSWWSRSVEEWCTCKKHRIPTSFEDPHDERETEKNLPILEKTETSISNQNQSHSSDPNVQSPLKSFKICKAVGISYHSNSENTHPETIFHYAKALVWLPAYHLPAVDLSFYTNVLTLTPILLRLAPMIGLTMKTVISKAPNTRPKCQTSSPLLTASRGKNGAWNMDKTELQDLALITRCQIHSKCFLRSHQVENWIKLIDS